MLVVQFYLPLGESNRALHQMSQLNFNTVYPVVWNRGQTFYPSSVAKGVTGRSQDSWLRVLRLGRDVLAEIVKQGQQQRLRVIPWFEYGFMAPAGSKLAKRHPDWITFRRDSTKTLRVDSLEQSSNQQRFSPLQKFHNSSVTESVKQFGSTRYTQKCSSSSLI